VEADHIIRIAAFLGILSLMACWEVIAPRRQSQTPKSTRWIINLAMSLTNSILLRLVFVSGAMGAALLAVQEGWGLLQILNWPMWSEVIVAIVILDLVVYAQHILFHKMPVLWRLHQVHHSDMEVDVTTGVRFHPVEIAISMLIKIGTIMLVGASPSAVLIFEVLLNGTAMFNHSNVRIPLQLDRLLRWMVVTPDMHRVHHSVIAEETNSNFGFNLPWWDRIFGSYQNQPCLGHEHMTIGLEQFRDSTRLSWWGLLSLPYKREPEIQPTIHDPFTNIESLSEDEQFKKSVEKEEEVLIS